MATQDSPKQEDTITFTPPMKEEKTKKPIGKIVAIVAIILVSIAAGFGLSYAVPQSNTSSRANTTTVCDAEVINEYNDITSVGITNNDERLAMNTKIKDLSTRVQAEESATDDPTCVYIAFLVAVNDRNAAEATSLATKLEELANRGRFIDTRLNSVISITQIKGTAAGLSAPNSELLGEG